MLENPEDSRFARALCEANICAISFTEQSREEGDGITSPEDILRYCKRGYSSVKDARGLVNKAYAEWFMKKDSASDAHKETLEKAKEKYSKDPLVSWFNSYSFEDGQLLIFEPDMNTDLLDSSGPIPADEIPVKANEIGDVLHKQDPWMSDDMLPNTAIVKRKGADVYLPDTKKKESKLQAGTKLDTKLSHDGRVPFIDSINVHWKKSYGWMLVEAKRSTRVENSGVINRFSNLSSIKSKLISRKVPNVYHWSGAKGKCRRGMFRGVYFHYLSCYYWKLKFKHGSVKFVEGTVTKRGEWRPGFQAWTTYRKVEFEERDWPERQVLEKDVYLIAENFTKMGLAQFSNVVESYTEWDEKLLDMVIKGEIRKGMPAFFLKILNWKLKGVMFDKDGFLQVWEDDDDNELLVRDGRVYAKVGGEK